MTANLAGFDASTVEPTTAYEVLPAGEYQAMITDSEMKTTKNGNGEYLQLTVEIIDGEYKGRLLWERLTLKHPNAKTVEIAQRTLSAICRAVGVLQPKDSAELHGVAFVVKVGIEAPKNGYDAQNRIKAYKSARQAQTAPPPAADQKMPWRK